MKTQNFSKIRLTFGAGLFVILLFTNGCSKSKDNTSNTGSGVNIIDMAFSPSVITVTENTTITWTNKDAISHTVTSDNGAFDSGSIAPNGTFSHTFTTAGNYPYHCTIHPTMVASVVVTTPPPSGY